MSNVLFILKRREDFDSDKHSNIGLSTGLYNSASFVSNMLLNQDIDAGLEVAIDANCIDRIVTAHRPTIVIIEAMWVTPSKFTELQRLHPNVTWVVRLHSELPFIAGEGMAIDWIGDYSTFKNVVIGVNAPRMHEEISKFLALKNRWDEEKTLDKVVFLPNYYPQTFKPKTFDRSKDVVDVGCFGAIRPMKNHLTQAFAAVEFAEAVGRKLRFHVNAGRVEMNGGPAFKNLRSLFEHLNDRGHELINHVWTPRDEFLVLCSTMDIGLQVSFSETFNIVGADLISQGVPLVGSREIPWITENCQADPTCTVDIARKLKHAYYSPEQNVLYNQQLLLNYTSAASVIWHKYCSKDNI